MSIWFRLKNKDLFKGKSHTPVIKKIVNLDYYKKCNYRCVKVITDYRSLDIADMIYLYRLLNNNMGDEFSVHRARYLSDNLFEISGHYSTTRAGCAFEIYINDCINDFYQTMWGMIKPKLFGHISSLLPVYDDNNIHLLELINCTSGIDICTLKNTKLVQINTSKYTVVTNAGVGKLIRVGHSSLTDNSDTIVEFELVDATRWVIAKPNDEYTPTLFYSRSNYNHNRKKWNSYVGIKH